MFSLEDYKLSGYLQLHRIYLLNHANDIMVIDNQMKWPLLSELGGHLLPNDKFKF